VCLDGFVDFQGSADESFLFFTFPGMIFGSSDGAVLAVELFATVAEEANVLKTEF
jgi:hypothetical protein